ncbi:hypothetical protein DY000_02063929 [Brassica cretica]|uniref:Thaumatin-like protein n=1 Tax=Brassica cretica TaxID=69181 RepID=A0ABQ7B122_BRACR|nr:hypothetical protein DY000_02063929 [Brassica cretica]
MVRPHTGCNFSSSGQGKCATGDCGGVLKCAAAGGVPPVTLAEFAIGDTDFYDVSLVDGYNVKIGIKPQGDCKYAGCSSDLNSICPNELRVMDPHNNVVACKSACEALNTPEYCCTGAFDKPETCPPTDYSRIFKKACPNAYSYAYDDATSTFTCSRSNYLITFCPTPRVLKNPDLRFRLGSSLSSCYVRKMKLKNMLITQTNAGDIKRITLCLISLCPVNPTVNIPLCKRESLAFIELKTTTFQ